MGTAPLPQAGPLRLFLQICYVQVYHIGQILWPRDLSSIRQPPSPVAFSNPLFLFCVVAGAVLAGSMVLFLRWSRGPLAGWLFYLVVLAAHFGVLVWFPVFAQGSYLYFPALGILLLVGSGLAAVWRSPWFGRRAAAALLATATLAAYAEFRGTRSTLHYWHDNDTLWTHFLEVSRDSPALTEKYGALLANEGRFEDAVRQFRRAVALAPADGGMHHNLGMALLRAGRLADAIPELETAPWLDPSEPEYARDLAVALRRAGRTAEAESRFRDVLRLKPGDVDALSQLGTLLAARGEVGQAIELARTAVALAPLDARAHFILAMALLQSGGAGSEVIAHLRDAVRYGPDRADACNQLAWLLATSPDPALLDPGEALRLSNRAVELTGRQDPNVLDTRAAAEAAAGRFDRAAETARDAARLAARLQADSLSLSIEKRMTMYQRGIRYTEAPHIGPWHR